MQIRAPFQRLGLIILVFSLTGCGLRQGSGDIGPVVTRDPLMFYAPTPVSPGRAENPLQIIHVPMQPDNENIDPSLNTLAVAVANNSGLTLQMLSVETEAIALAAICDYNDDDRFSAAWLKPVIAVMAVARDCGDVILVGARDGHTDIVMDIVSAQGITSLNALQNSTFCRLGVGDYYSWILPALAMKSNLLDPTVIGSIVDYEAYPAIFDAILAGECDATGTPSGLIEGESIEDDVRDALSVAYQSPPMPYVVLVAPHELLPQDRDALVQGYLSFASVEQALDDEESETPVVPEDLEPVYVDIDISTLRQEQQALIWLSDVNNVFEASNDDLADALQFMERTNLDLVEFGR